MSIEERKKAFHAIDKDGSGIVNFKEWYKHFKAMMKLTNISEEELQSMYRAYDEAGSSRGLDFKEYSAFMNDVLGPTNSGLTGDKREAFNHIDKDGTGLINFKEWYKHYKNLIDDTNLTEQELLMMYQIYDEATSASGLSFEEYSAFMDDVFDTTVHEPNDNKSIAFKDIDKDGSGIVTLIEWYKYYKPLLKKTNLTIAELRQMYKVYDEAGSSRGLNMEEYTAFMDDVFTIA